MPINQELSKINLNISSQLLRYHRYIGNSVRQMFLNALTDWGRSLLRMENRARIITVSRKFFGDRSILGTDLILRMYTIRECPSVTKFLPQAEIGARASDHWAGHRRHYQVGHCHVVLPHLEQITFKYRNGEVKM